MLYKVIKQVMWFARQKKANFLLTQTVHFWLFEIKKKSYMKNQVMTFLTKQAKIQDSII